MKTKEFREMDEMLLSTMPIKKWKSDRELVPRRGDTLECPLHGRDLQPHRYVQKSWVCFSRRTNVFRDLPKNNLICSDRYSTRLSGLKISQSPIFKVSVF